MKTFVAFLTTLGLIASGLSTAFAKDFPEGSPKFETRYSTALKKAEKEGKPLLVVFSAAWCPPCQANKKDVYPSETVKPYHDKFIWAYLDIDEQRNAKVAQEFGVTGIPHIEFLSKEGKRIDKTMGGTTPEDFAKTLDGILKKTAKKE